MYRGFGDRVSGLHLDDRSWHHIGLQSRYTRRAQTTRRNLPASSIKLLCRTRVDYTVLTRPSRADYCATLLAKILGKSYTAVVESGICVNMSNSNMTLLFSVHD